jgi:aldehyde dehydrogenase (NAD+)
MTVTTEVNQASRYASFDSMPIAGEWRAGHGAATISDLDPWSGDVLAEIPAADASDLDAAFTAARSAQPAWSSLPPSERADVMSRAAQIMTDRRDEIIDWLIHEVGGSVIKSTTEWMVVRADFLQAARLPYQVEGRILGSDIPGKEHRVYRQPVGVVLLISPWNWPLHLTARSLAPALAVGNGVVIKPATDTPVTGGLLLARILEEAGLPPGVLNVVIGRGADIGDAAVEHPVPRVISFTGSTAVGLGITRKAGVKRLCLELGGNGPLVVLDDADLDLAAVSGPMSWVYSHGGVFPVRRGDQDEEAFTTAFRILDRGGAMLMYCEGTRSRTGELAASAKPGVGGLALESGAPVVPVTTSAGDRRRRSTGSRTRRSVGAASACSQPSRSSKRSRSACT